MLAGCVGNGSTMGRRIGWIAPVAADTVRLAPTMWIGSGAMFVDSPTAASVLGMEISLCVPFAQSKYDWRSRGRSQISIERVDQAGN